MKRWIGTLAQNQTASPDHFCLLSLWNYLHWAHIFTFGWTFLLALASQIEVRADALDQWTSFKSNIHTPVDVTYGNGMFVAAWYPGMSDFGNVYYSTDTTNWSAAHTHTPGIFDDWFYEVDALTFGGGKLVAVGWNGTVYNSTSGINWEYTGVNAEVTFIRAIHGNGQFLALGFYFGQPSESVSIFTSTDGSQWSRAQGTGPSMKAAAYGNGKYIALSSYPQIILFSEDGTNWRDGSAGLATLLSGAYTLHDITFGNGQFAILGVGSNDAGSYTMALTSPDGLNWSKNIVSTNRWPFRLYHGNGTFIAIGDGGTLLTSIDLSHWQVRDVGTNSNLSLAVFGGDSLYLFGADSLVLKSQPMGPRLLADEPGGLILRGLPGRNYRLEAKVQLDPNATWKPLTNLMLESEAIAWREPQATTNFSRFYRAVLVP